MRTAGRHSLGWDFLVDGREERRWGKERQELDDLLVSFLASVRADMDRTIVS